MEALYFADMKQARFTFARAIFSAAWLCLSLAESVQAHDCPQHTQPAAPAHSLSHSHSLPLTLHAHSNSHSTPHSHFCTCKSDCCVSVVALPSIRFATTQPLLQPPTPTNALTANSYFPTALSFARPPTTGPPTPQVA